MVDAPAAYGSSKTLYNRFQRWAPKGCGAKSFHALADADGPPTQLLIDSSAVRTHRCAAGERNHAIGRSGGRTTKIHGLTDGLWRPVPMLTGGQFADCKAVKSLE
ncbi:hypothetical protein EOB36_26325 [Mesorhizobium sp. M6A.T.Cr.TU.017.01.1.1]|nr:hypothetical protein EOB36_26325 [Mesorhizobium sp. M6A.T.Cr.TU.017.01.1.1]